LSRVRIPEGAFKGSVLVGCELLGRGFFFLSVYAGLRVMDGNGIEWDLQRTLIEKGLCLFFCVIDFANFLQIF